jgi:hypothetical protein
VLYRDIWQAIRYAGLLGTALSETVLKIIPTDQDYVPSPETQQKAIALLREMLPDGEMHEARAYNHLCFIDQGQYCEAVLCSSCGRHLPIDPFTENDQGMLWWYGMTDVIAAGTPVSDFQTTMPCCGARVPLTSLQFHLPAGFARFELIVWNPHAKEGVLNADQLGQLEAVFGRRLTQIQARY